MLAGKQEVARLPDAVGHVPQHVIDLSKKHLRRMPV
jgi:hypothetical protein